jgi:DNA phosphorothioation-dependent restriction protein DptG
MSYLENLKELRKSLRIKDNKQGLTHTINVNSPILPFPTRNPERAKFARGFDGVTGEFTRIVSNSSLNEEVEMKTIVENISQNVNMAEEDKPHFIRLIRMFLSGDKHSMKVFHPHILQYIPLTSGSESKGEANIALFMRDVLLVDQEELRVFFKKSDTDHLVAKLILDQLDFLKEKKREKKYFAKLPHIAQVFTEDILFMTKHREFFVENIHLFLAYYYFFYITQLTLKLAQRHKAHFNNVNEVVYTLDWEGTSKSRVGYERGYQQIKENARELLLHINCLEHLNTIFGTKALSYPELKEIYNKLSDENKNEFLSALKMWIEEYRYHASLPSITFVSEDYEGLVGALFKSLSEGVSEETKSRYALSIEEIGKRYFLKTRGALGYMLNVSQEFLLLMTAVSVKDSRKSLKDVFSEFEKRGIFFDRYSQEAVVHLFDKLNLLDKKSDSGDAQYVKPIL